MGAKAAQLDPRFNLVRVLSAWILAGHFAWYRDRTAGTIVIINYDIGSRSYLSKLFTNPGRKLGLYEGSSSSTSLAYAHMIPSKHPKPRLSLPASSTPLLLSLLLYPIPPALFPVPASHRSLQKHNDAAHGQ